MKKCLICFFVILVILTGCSKSQNGEPGTTEKKPAATSTQNAERNAEENLKIRLLGTRISADEETPTYLAVMEENNSFEILSFKENGETADALLLVRAPDLYTVLTDVSARTELSEEEMFASLAQELQTAPVLETEVALQFQQIDDEWQPILTTEFMDAYYGGILRLRAEMLGSEWESGVDE